MTNRRREEILDNLLCYMAEAISGGDLYDALTESIGLTDEELAELGFEYLLDMQDDD